MTLYKSHIQLSLYWSEHKEVNCSREQCYPEVKLHELEQDLILLAIMLTKASQMSACQNSVQ